MAVDCMDDLVIKSPTDRRSYRILHLSNGLTAVLVHDPDIFPDVAHRDKSEADIRSGALDTDDNNMKEDDDDGDSECSHTEDDDDDEESECFHTEDEEDDEIHPEKMMVTGAKPTKKAAAAMCVGMGSFSDPEKAQGLAHFLEHMLFMGSSDFPDENEYDSYLSKHGGSSNAYTETEYTCYHFEVNYEHLKGALERFSQFFISPLVKAEAMEREVLAVDSEFNQVLQSDSCRLLQLTCHTSTPCHPFNRFFWGNRKSLVDAMDNGVNLREEILQMYKEYYLGGIMKLVVIGGESLDILEKWILELFSGIQKGNPVRAIAGCDIPIWKPGKLYRLEAVKDIHVLDLSWRLPCLHKEYLKKPEDYLAHLLGHEGKGSLLYFLKAKGWATSLSAGVGDEGMRRSSIAYVFVMSINLTDSGVETVCGRVYCKHCVDEGMGEMKEGRKCVECLGRRFSQRYIKRAGKDGCFSVCPNEVKRQELVWAAMGPAKGGDEKKIDSYPSRSRCSTTEGISLKTHANRSGPTIIVTRSPGFDSTPNRVIFDGK